VTTPQVVVIGGGPAGLAAAITCARQGVPTRLVERQSFPINKACGEGLLPNGVSALSRLGLDMTRVRDSAAHISGIRYVSRKGRSAEATFSHGYGLGLRRVDVSTLLHAHASSLPALTIQTGHPASLTFDAQARPVVQVGSETLRPRLVIGADGLHSRTRHTMGSVVTERPRRRWGCRQHFEGEAWTDHVEVYFGRGFEVYVTPLKRGVTVAVLWEGPSVRPPSGQSPVVHLASQVPPLWKHLNGRRVTDRPQADGPFDVRVPRPWRAGVLLVGDAAGYGDPVTGEGVGLALEQALLLAGTVVPALQVESSDVVVPADVLADFTRRARAHARTNRHLTAVLLALTRVPALTECAVAALASHRSLFTHLLDVNMGRRSPA